MSNDGAPRKPSSASRGKNRKKDHEQPGKRMSHKPTDKALAELAEELHDVMMEANRLRVELKRIDRELIREGWAPPERGW